MTKQEVTGCRRIACDMRDLVTTRSAVFMRMPPLPPPLSALSFPDGEADLGAPLRGIWLLAWVGEIGLPWQAGDLMAVLRTPRLDPLIRGTDPVVRSHIGHNDE